MAGSSRRVLFYVQHLLGTGHLRRTALLAKSAADAGCEVHLVSGGMPVEGLDIADVNWHQLPAVRAADATFSTLIDSAGNEASPATMTTRAAQLEQLARSVRPELVIIESWPFGRRKLRHELLQLMNALTESRPRPIIACSVRDILQRKTRPERVEEIVQLVQAWFDHVLVHADPGFVTLDHSFDRADEFAEKIVYTGFVTTVERTPKKWRGNLDGPVVVSAGGGAVGETIYLTACEAARRSEGRYQWHLLVGRNLRRDVWERLQAQAPSGVTIDWARTDFDELLAGCGVSISQAGYNTTLDLAACGCPAVVVPFAGQGETEQLDRARRLDALGMAHCVTEQELAPDTLLKGIEAAQRDHPKACGFDTGGAGFTASWIRSVWVS